MLRFLKKIISALTVISVILTGFVFPSSAQSVVTYEIWGSIPSTGAPYSEVTNGEVTIWLNGGKATMSNNAVTESKIFTASLFYVESDGATGKKTSHNITAAKNVGWAVGSETQMHTSNGKPQSKFPSGSQYFSVSKGKVTADKYKGSGYAWAYRIDKVGKTTTYVPLAKFKVNVLAAPTVLEIQDGEVNGALGGKDSNNKAFKLSSVPVSVGQTEAFAIKNANKKSGSTILPSDSSGTFTVTVKPTVVKTNKNGVSVSENVYYANVSSSGSDGTFDTNTTVVNNGADEHNLNAPIFYVRGLKLAASADKNGAPVADKIAKATITITNNQSGKSVNLTVNVGNNIKETNDTKNIAIASPGSGENTKVTQVNLMSSGIITPYDSSGTKISITAKPTLAIYTDAVFSSLYYTNGALDKSKFLANGKLKLLAQPSTTAAANKLPSGFAVKLVNDGFNYKVDVTVPKLNSAGKYWVVAGYGSLPNEIACFSFDVLPPAPEMLPADGLKGLIPYPTVGGTPKTGEVATYERNGFKAEITGWSDGTGTAVSAFKSNTVYTAKVNIYSSDGCLYYVKGMNANYLTYPGATVTHAAVSSSGISLYAQVTFSATEKQVSLDIFKTVRFPDILDTNGLYNKVPKSGNKIAGFDSTLGISSAEYVYFRNFNGTSPSSLSYTTQYEMKIKYTLAPGFTMNGINSNYFVVPQVADTAGTQIVSVYPMSNNEMRITIKTGKKSTTTTTS